MLSTNISQTNETPQPHNLRGVLMTTTRKFQDYTRLQAIMRTIVSYELVNSNEHGEYKTPDNKQLGHSII